jgi:hypothetical protein
MKKIEWLAPNKSIFNNVVSPTPSKKTIPEWYKKIKKFDGNKINILKKNNNVYANTTVKSCIPFFDSMSHGFIQQTWCDIYIEKNNDEINYFWSLEPQIISHRENISSYEMLKNEEFYNLEFLWKQYWVPKLPSGYSMLFVHPLNRTDLPFFTLSGIVDSDMFYETPEDGASIPFYIKRNFSGIIPAGTPMYQMIPIKRNFCNKTIKKINNYKKRKVKTFFYDGYKKMYWQKKFF